MTRANPIAADRRRSGNATIELAVTLPILVTILLGSVEVCGHIYTKQATRSAAHECALIAADAAGTDALLQAKLSQILTPRGVNDGTVITDPVSIQGLSLGTRITVTVAAPASSNSLVPVNFYSSPIESTCVVVKEL